jgi:predicted GH43/DUF377 family glycosyl hydrolase
VKKEKPLLPLESRLVRLIKRLEDILSDSLVIFLEKNNNNKRIVDKQMYQQAYCLASCVQGSIDFANELLEATINDKPGKEKSPKPVSRSQSEARSRSRDSKRSK